MKRFFAYIPVTLALLVIAATGVFLIQQNVRAHTTRLESKAVQIMAGVVERYGGERSFDPQQWDDLVGLGLYDAQGNPAYRFGTAPAQLAPEGLETGYFTVSGSSIAMIRRTGVVPGLDGPGFLRGRRPPLQRRIPGHAPGSMHTMPMHQGPVAMRHIQTIFMELNASSLQRQAFLQTSIVAALFIALMGTVVVVFRYSRRLSRYRDREQKNAYLVQLGEAARTLAHEIKNPLGVIRIQCATLERSLPGSYGQNLAIIREETDRLAALTDRLRDFLKNGTGSPQVIKLETLIKQVQERYGPSLSVHPGDVSGVCMVADPDHLVQMIDNLVSNALDASVDTAIPPEFSVSVERGLVHLALLDRGVGVPEDKQAQLFELFFTTKTRGSGIGLALVKRLAESNGGTVGYRNRRGGGSEFWITIPARRCEDVANEYT